MAKYHSTSWQSTIVLFMANYHGTSCKMDGSVGPATVITELPPANNTLEPLVPLVVTPCSQPKFQCECCYGMSV